MTPGDWVVASPLLIILIFTVWYFFPFCIFVFSPSAIRSYFKEDDSCQIMEREDVQQLTNELKTLGFEYMGIKVEKFPLWKSSSEQVSFSSIDTISFATIYIQRKKIVYYFLTPFSEGHLVLTSNSLFQPISTDELVQSSIAFSEPKDLLNAHKKIAASLIEKGYSPFQEYSKQTRLKATNMYYQSTPIKNQMRNSGILSLSMIIIVAIFFLLIVLK
jgi:hypothetical protein